MSLVDIIIPTLNEEKFIEQCLQSIESQDFSQNLINIYVIDGGSNDRTCEIVCEYAKSHDNVNLINNPKRIQSAAFNLGVQSSSSPYVLRFDAHATYNKAYVRSCIEHLSQNKSLGNVGGVWEILPSRMGLIPESNALLNKLKFGIGGASFRIGAVAGYVDTVPFGAFPREVIDELGGMREDLCRGEDNEYNSRITKAGYKIYFDPKIISQYYARDTIKGSVKQMYANGESIGQLFYIDRDSIGLRHAVPLAFVLSIIASCIISYFSYYGIFLLSAVLGSYAIANIICSAQAAIQYGLKYFFCLPILFLLIHISYGLGTIKGLIKYN